MKKCYFRFYAGLNRFFSSSEDGKIHIHYFQGRQSIKDRIETLGVPHTEVELILKKRQILDFSYLVQDEDRFGIFPHFKTLELKESQKLRPSYPHKPKFILDTHLGKLARYLRRFGFNSLYRNDYDDKEIVDIAENEKRIILTRDHGLLMRKRVTYGYFIHYDNPREQLKSVYNRYNLFQYKNINKRCTECNASLQPVEKGKIIDRLEPKTKKYFQEFYICPVCNKIFWKGSHYQKTEKLLEEIYVSTVL